MELIHFYHVFADGNWEIPVNEHIAALKSHDLYKNLNKFYIGFVGNVANIDLAKQHITQKCDFEVIKESPAGWEQETMKEIPSLIANKSANVLYAHTKSASDTSEINVAWRKSMTFFNIVKWKKASGKLKTYDTCGCHLVEDQTTGVPFYGGTFWWATAKYLQTLPPIKENNRWDAELWIGQNPEAKHFDTNPGWPAHNLFTTSW